MKKLLVLFLLFPVLLSNVLTQEKIAVLPFQNMDGELTLNIHSYKLQDSVFKALQALDPNEEHYQLVPLGEIEMLLSEMNLDPTNPQYQTDMWKAVEMLGVTRVVTGNFNVRAERFLINAYVYDVDTKLPNLEFQARDIFLPEEKILKSVQVIVKRLKPALIK